jgi:hypothetical protein
LRKANASAAAKSTEPEGKGSIQDSYAQGPSRGKGKGKKKEWKQQEKRKGNAPEEKDLSDVECYHCHKKGHYANKCPELDLREKSKDKQSKQSKKD